MKGWLASTGDHSSCGGALKGSPSLYLLKTLSPLHLNKNRAARRFYSPVNGKQAPLMLHLGRGCFPAASFQVGDYEQGLIPPLTRGQTHDLLTSLPIWPAES